MGVESSIPTKLQAKATEVLVEATLDNLDAQRWLIQLFNAAMTWDHIEDREEIDVRVADASFVAMWTDWPMNDFFIKNRVVLVPVLVNAISAWKSSNESGMSKIKAYDIFTESICAVLWILGGQSRVDWFMPKIRRLVQQICNEDELKDGGAK